MARCWQLRRRQWQLGLLASAVLASVPVAAAESDGMTWDAEARLAYHDNLSRAQRQADVVEDVSTEVGLTVAGSHGLSRRARLFWSGRLGMRVFKDVDDLNAVDATARLRLRTALGDGYTSPWIEAGLALTAVEHAESPIRDGGWVDLGLATGQRLTDRLRWRGDWRYRARETDKDVVFDTRSHRFSLQADLAVGQRVTLFGRSSYSHGDVVSTAVPTADIVAAASAISREPDAVFGPGKVQGSVPPGPGPGPSPSPGPNPVPGPGPGPVFAADDRVAYRLRADTVTLGAGVHLALQPGLALEADLGWFDVDAKGGIEYDGWTAGLSLLGRF